MFGGTLIERFGALVRFSTAMSDFFSKIGRDIKAIWDALSRVLYLIPDLMAYFLPYSLMFILLLCFCIAIIYKILGRE